MNKDTTVLHAVGIVIVTHGTFGAALLSSAEMIIGSQEDIGLVSLAPLQSGEEIVDEIREAVKKREQGAGVLVLTDLFGGSPTTLSLSLLREMNLEVVTGLNLPLLIKALQSRNRTLPELAALVREAGCNGIVAAGEMLRVKR